MEPCADMTLNHSLPIILISAFDLTSASVLLSEIIGDKTSENGGITQSRVWTIINKYYRVDVQIYSIADNESPPPSIAEQVEAHIIFITDDEDNENAPEVAEERWTRAASAGERAHIRLLVSAGARAPPALAAWARRRRYELVALRESAADDSDDDAEAPFPSAYGAERARAALHAHVWRGLERLDRPAPRAAAPAPAAPDVTSSDEEYEGVFEEREEEDDETAVERAEAFAEALGALGAAGAEARGLAQAERLRRAESLVVAFCRALGADLPAL